MADYTSIFLKPSADLHLFNETPTDTTKSKVSLNLKIVGNRLDGELEQVNFSNYNFNPESDLDPNSPTFKDKFKFERYSATSNSPIAIPTTILQNGKEISTDFFSITIDNAGGLKINPKLAGIIYCRFIFFDRGNTTNETVFHEIIFRIWIHDKINSDGNKPKIWIANNRISVYEGTEDKLLNVYAEFKDGSNLNVANITGHSYVYYHSSDTSLVTINDEGRVKGITAGSTGTDFNQITHGIKWKPNGQSIEPNNISSYDINSTHASLFVRVFSINHQPSLISPAFESNFDPNNYNGSTTSTTNKVEARIEKELVANNRPLLEILSTPITKVNPKDVYQVLFLPEGFRSYTDFNKKALDIIEHWKKNSNSPFDLLKDYFKFWMAFEPSFSNEITISHGFDKSNVATNPDVQLVSDSFPTSELISNYIKDEGLLDIKDTRFSLTVGSRLGTKISEKNLYLTNVTDNSFYKKFYSHLVSKNVLDFDLNNFGNFSLTPKDALLRLENYIRTLISPDGNTLGSNWIITDENRKHTDKFLICIIANENYKVGTAFHSDFKRYYMASTIGTSSTIKVIKQDNTYRNINNLRPSQSGVSYNTFSHELAHLLLFAGDEYGKEGVASLNFTNNNINPHYDGVPRIKSSPEFRPNLTILHSLLDTPTTQTIFDAKTIDPTKVKWGHWSRIEFASRIRETVSVNTGDTYFFLIIDKADQEMWEQLRNEKIYDSNNPSNLNINREVFIKILNTKTLRPTADLAVPAHFVWDPINVDAVTNLKYPIFFHYAESYKLTVIDVIPKSLDNSIPDNFIKLKVSLGTNSTANFTIEENAVIYAPFRPISGLDIKILEGGENYFTGEKILFTGGGGTKAHVLIKQVDSAGKITEIETVSPGAGYTYISSKTQYKKGKGKGAKFLIRLINPLASINSNQYNSDMKSFMINPIVMQHMIDEGKPLFYTNNCSLTDEIITQGPIPTKSVINDSNHPYKNIQIPSVSNIKFNPPKLRYMINAIYEGGGKFNCGVYRSTGQSKMRNDNIILII